MKRLYRYDLDCGRMGNVEGVFVATQEQIELALGKQVYFGEILGKHSEIYADLDMSQLTPLTEDQDFINKFEEFLPNGAGYDPLCYLSEDEQE